jgi:WD40 repeat protein
VRGEPDTEGIKIWSLRTRTCIRTLEGGYALAAVFAPSNRHVIVGTKAGTLELYDVGAATLLATQEAHTGAVWAVALTADGRGVVTGSADHDVKFWEFELAEHAGDDGQVRPSLSESLSCPRTLARPRRRPTMPCSSSSSSSSSCSCCSYCSYCCSCCRDRRMQVYVGVDRCAHVTPGRGSLFLSPFCVCR